MKSKIIRILARNQLTLPKAIVKELALSEGDFLEVSVAPGGQLRLRPATVLYRGDSAAAALQRAKAKADVKAGRTTAFDTAGDLVRDLKRRRATTTKVRARSVAVESSSSE